VDIEQVRARRSLIHVVIAHDQNVIRVVRESVKNTVGRSEHLEDLLPITPVNVGCIQMRRAPGVVQVAGNLTNRHQDPLITAPPEIEDMLIITEAETGGDFLAIELHYSQFDFRAVFVGKGHMLAGRRDGHVGNQRVGEKVPGADLSGRSCGKRERQEHDSGDYDVPCTHQHLVPFDDRKPHSVADRAGFVSQRLRSHRLRCYGLLLNSSPE